ncbi:MAG: hypothetical protein CL606_06905 [Anaerolineaceae bacterium]|nr:hypothetical protein [Anaerolineaceae bacterium]
MLSLVKQLFLISLGITIGGLVNYLADQLPSRKNFSYPLCRHCCKTISPIRWISLMNFVVGNCECDNKISLRPVLVELFFGVCLPLIDESISTNTHFVVSLLLLVCFSLIIVIDIEHKLILNSVIVPTACVALLYGMQTNNQNLFIILASGIAGYLIMLMIFFGGKLYWKLFLKHKGLPDDLVVFGMGDVRLGGLIGLATGWSELPQTMVVSFIGIGIVAIAIKSNSSYKPFTMLPVGPFLIVGALIVLFFI